MFGATVGLARGPLAFSRLTGAPIVPFVLRWDGAASARAVVGDPIGPEAEEQVAADAVAGWFEAYLRADPAQLSPVLAAALIRTLPAPAARAGGGGAPSR